VLAYHAVRVTPTHLTISILLVTLTFGLLRVADLLVHLLHVGVQGGCVKRVLHGVPGDGVEKHVEPAVRLHPVGAVAERVLISVIGLIVNHTPLVLGNPVAHAVVEVWQTIAKLPMTIRKGFRHFLATAVKVRIEEPMTCKDANHETHSHGCDPPIRVGWRVREPCMDHVVVVIISHDRVGLGLQEDGVSLAQGERGECPSL